MRRIAFALIAALCACAAGAPTGAERLDGRASYPEGPLWRDGRLYVAEMGADRISVFEHGAERTFWSRAGCGPTALAPYGDGFLILCHLEGAVVAIDARGQVRFTRESDDEGHAFRDPNDAYEDGRGGVYFSDPGIFYKRAPPQGALMHIDAAGHVRRLAENLWYPNGVFVDLARRQLYLSETFHRRVLRYALNADGSLGPMEVFAQIDRFPAQTRYETPYPEAGPDGLEIAPDGALYVAIYGEGRILRLSPAGAYEGQLDEPARYLTNIAFDAAGDAATTGSFDNDTPPFPGEVRLHSAAELAALRAR